KRILLDRCDADGGKVLTLVATSSAVFRTSVFFRRRNGGYGRLIFSFPCTRYAWRMPDNQDSSSATPRAALDGSDPAGESASDEPDQPDGAVAEDTDAPQSAARRSF